MTTRKKFDDIIGRADNMQRVYDLIEKIASTTTTVLIQGATGSGKELAARAIVRYSPRKYQSFIKIDCTALPETLLESELFGYKKGAFTDARIDKPGKFDLADKGTIFLDEIGEIPMSIQAKLLRVLEENVFEPLGGLTSVRIDVRIITATNRNLQDEMNKGLFRKDLFYRLNVFPITLPELKEHIEDLPLLTEHFIARFNIQFMKNVKKTERKVMELFMTYSWPGNVRQLRHVLEYAFINCTGDTIKVEHLPDEIRVHAWEYRTDQSIDDPFQASEKKVLIETLKKYNNNRKKTAQTLHCSRVTLWRKMKKYGLI